MNKCHIDIEVFKEYKGSNYVWIIRLNNESRYGGVERTYIEALDAVNSCLNIVYKGFS